MATIMKPSYELKKLYGVLRLNNTATITVTDFDYDHRTFRVNIKRPLRNATYHTRSYLVKENSATEKRLMKVLTVKGYSYRGELTYDWV